MRLLPLRSLSLALALAGAALSGTACGPTVEGPGAVFDPSNERILG